MFIAELFAEGGWLMPVILLAFLIGLGLSIAQLTFLRRLDLSAAIIGSLAAVLVLGLLGAAWGVHWGLAASASGQDAWVSPLTVGLAKALNTTILSGILGLPLTVLALIAVAHRPLAKGNDSRA